MCGCLGTGAMLGAKIRTHTPENKPGMLRGMRIFCQVLIPLFRADKKTEG